MNTAQIIEKLNQLIQKDAKGIDSSFEFQNETDLINDLGYDSVAIIQLVVNIEIEFYFEFGDTDILVDNLVKYGNLKDYVLKNTLAD
jgi:acyl carrier protein